MSNTIIPNFTSYSGDRFYIDPKYYDAEVKIYNDALASGDEATMMKFEEGNTGWIYYE